MNKLGVALGGGGARGFAHLGVIKALKEKGIEADVYAGTSAGSIAGTLLAAGFNPDEVFQKMRENSFSDYTKIQIPKDGLFNLGGIGEKLEKHLKVRNVEELEKPMYIAVSNINSGAVEYFSKGKVRDLVLASSSIPVLFSPQLIQGQQYLDGGVFDNVPVAPLRPLCQKVIGINLMPVSPTKRVKNLVEVALRTFQLSVEANTAQSRKMADLFIEPEGIDEFGILNPSNAEQLFELGYEHTRKLALNTEEWTT